MDKYLDQEEMDSLIKEAPPKFKLNYNLFKLDPIEKEIMREYRNQKRNFTNPDDPFLKPLRFEKLNKNVYGTSQILKIISPKNHSDLMSSKISEIKDRSNQIREKYCDKEQIFYKFDGTIGNT